MKLLVLVSLIAQFYAVHAEKSLKIQCPRDALIINNTLAEAIPFRLMKKNDRYNVKGHNHVRDGSRTYKRVTDISEKKATFEYMREQFIPAYGEICFDFNRNGGGEGYQRVIFGEAENYANKGAHVNLYINKNSGGIQVDTHSVRYSIDRRPFNISLKKVDTNNYETSRLNIVTKEQGFECDAFTVRNKTSEAILFRAMERTDRVHYNIREAHDNVINRRYWQIVRQQQHELMFDYQLGKQVIFPNREVCIDFNRRRGGSGKAYQYLIFGYDVSSQAKGAIISFQVNNPTRPGSEPVLKIDRTSKQASSHLAYNIDLQIEGAEESKELLIVPK